MVMQRILNQIDLSQEAWALEHNLVEFCNN